jgi:hypothetical protein
MCRPSAAQAETEGEIMKEIVRHPNVYIEYDRALSLVNDEIAKEGPQYTYTRDRNGACWNVEYDESTGEWVGSCLVGRALIAAGVDPERLGYESVRDADVRQVESVLGELKMTEKAMDFLAHVQGSQDIGRMWGEAVTNAVELAFYDNQDDSLYL